MKKAVLIVALAGGAQAFSAPPPGALFAPAAATPLRVGLMPAARAPLLRARGASVRRAEAARGRTTMAGEHVANVAVVLLAGGVGSRMKAGKPKQFLELEGKTILRTSLDVFLGIEGVASVSVVLAEEYRDQLADVAAKDPRESAPPTRGAPRACLPRQPRLCLWQRGSLSLSPSRRGQERCVSVERFIESCRHLPSSRQLTACI